MSRRTRLWVLRAVLLLALPASGLLIAIAAQDWAVGVQVRRQVEDLPASLLNRIERAVDYAVIAASELVEEGVDTCSDEVAERIRNIVLAAGPVKDIQLLSDQGAPTCSGQTSGAGENGGAQPYVGGVPARNSNYILHAVDGPRSTLLGIVWHSGASPDIAALVDLDMLMFDVFPEWLRDHAHAELSLGDRTTIARYEPEGTTIEPSESAMVTFSIRSGRFPLSVAMRLPQSALAAGKSPVSPLVGVAGLLAGLLVSSLSIRAFAPDPSPLADLDDAIGNLEIQPYFQPLASLRDGAITGVEVLARWVKPDGRIISPDRFIPMAEEHGRSAALTLSIADQALRDMAGILSKGETFKLAINIVPDDLLRDNFIEDLGALVSRHGVAASQVVLEMTERQPIADIKEAKVRIDAARAKGFRISIDDAGAGHNGLSNIQALGAQILKIDKVFIDLLDIDHAANAIVELLVRLGNRLGMTIVAEGVETGKQTARLKEIGVHEVQGYFVGRPMDARAIQTFIRDWRGGVRHETN